MLFACSHTTGFCCVSVVLRVVTFRAIAVHGNTLGENGNTCEKSPVFIWSNRWSLGESNPHHTPHDYRIFTGQGVTCVVIRCVLLSKPVPHAHIKSSDAHCAWGVPKTRLLPCDLGCCA